MTFVARTRKSRREFAVVVMRVNDRPGSSVAPPLLQYPVQTRAAATNMSSMVTVRPVNQLREAVGGAGLFGTDLAQRETQ